MTPSRQQPRASRAADITLRQPGCRCSRRPRPARLVPSFKCRHRRSLRSTMVARQPTRPGSPAAPTAHTPRHRSGGCRPSSGGQQPVVHRTAADRAWRTRPAPARPALPPSRPGIASSRSTPAPRVPIAVVPRELPASGCRTTPSGAPTCAGQQEAAGWPTPSAWRQHCRGPSRAGDAAATRRPEPAGARRARRRRRAAGGGDFADDTARPARSRRRRAARHGRPRQPSIVRPVLRRRPAAARRGGPVARHPPRGTPLSPTRAHLEHAAWSRSPRRSPRARRWA